MAMKRTGKFYRKNEAEVMKSLGLKPTPNSGSGWIFKEDGQSEEIICQLKSTDAESIRIHKKDLDKLSYNAAVAHKLPVFAIQFLQSNEVYLLVKPDIIREVAQCIKTGERINANTLIDIDLSDHEDVVVIPKRIIKSSLKARKQFNEENEKRFKKEKRSAT